MDLDGDIECTCDVGAFSDSSCPACSRLSGRTQQVRDRRKRTVKVPSVAEVALHYQKTQQEDPTND